MEIYLKFPYPNPNPEIQPRKISDPKTNITNTDFNGHSYLTLRPRYDGFHGISRYLTVSWGLNVRTLSNQSPIWVNGHSYLLS